MRILVLAGDADRLQRALVAGGCEVTVKSRSEEAEHLLLCERFDAVVFYPSSADPYFLGRMLREHPGRALVVWLHSSSSARVSELLEAGADEVLDGTMDDREILARVRNAARHGRRPAERTLEIGKLRIVSPSGKTSWRGKPVPLSRRERGVLLALAEANDETVPREVIYRKVWGYNMIRGDRSVDVYVKRLRDKLAQAEVDLRVSTTPSVGYRLVLPLSEPAETVVAVL
ncbi:MAG: response regulator transcription factor [Gaiellaceae bacterium]|jgi:DNA-binding response OmpR family regulator